MMIGSATMTSRSDYDHDPARARDELKYECCVKDCTNRTHGLKCEECREGRTPDKRGSAAATSSSTKHPKSPIKVNEAEIRVAIKDYYRLRGAKVWDTEQNRADARVDAGVADLIVARPSKPMLFVETKSDSGRQRPAQKEFEEAVIASGAVYIMPRSLQEVIDYEEDGF
jgi:hypothetical protein